MTTFLHKAKCLSCSLHFIACSFNSEWKPQFCPECGGNESFLCWAPQETDRFIFEFVPGGALLEGLSA